MELYVFINHEDNSYYKEAFTNRKTALEMYDYLQGQYFMKGIDLPFIGRSVCYVKLYLGFDYDWSNGSIYHVIQYSDIFSYSAFAKGSPQWEFAALNFVQDPINHIATDNMIASCEDGVPFTYGDICNGYFNAQIRRIRVIRS